MSQKRPREVAMAKETESKGDTKPSATVTTSTKDDEESSQPPQLMCLSCHKPVDAILDDDEEDSDYEEDDDEESDEMSETEDEHHDGTSKPRRRRRKRTVQVQCDTCLTNCICTDCHWCHEYQAHHEIRVCNVCTTFSCRDCDPMENALCDDCGQVICSKCCAAGPKKGGPSTTLLSCKFCGGGLCEDCATACGRCGIVLCSRDAKFAVDCDVCRSCSYCLVCLASSSKDVCVRCGHRPSKRMEQLVHLRLKSIYKAFKQSNMSQPPPSASGAATASSAGASSGSTANDSHTAKGASSASKKKNVSSALIDEAEKHAASLMMDTAEELFFNSHDTADMDGDLPLPPHSLFQAAASAVKNSASGSGGSRNSMTMSALMSQHSGGSKSSSSSLNAEQQKQLNERTASLSAALEEQRKQIQKYMAEKEKEADAAAAALLAELEQEEEEADNKSNKKKKAKKKKRNKKMAEQLKQASMAESSATGGSDDTDDDMDAKPKATPTSPASRSARDDDDDSQQNEADVEQQQQRSTKSEPAEDPLEEELAELIEEEDIEGIEELLASVKGVPGRAVIRKSAKKALKRLRTKEQEEQQEEEELHAAAANNASAAPRHRSGSVTPTTDGGQAEVSCELLKVVSLTHNKSAATDRMGSARGSIRNSVTSTPGRCECVMNMAPHIVGWVIGKGGQRIRDIMEESGARVWIDQDNMGPNDPRIVYVSGPRKSVDSAIHLIEDLINKAPAGTPHSTKQSGTPMPDSNVSSSGKQNNSAGGAGKPPLIPDDTPPSSGGDETRPTGNLKPRRSHGGDNRSKHIMTCDPRFVPLLIGRRGWTIKHIQDTSGARVDIDQTVTPRKITVSGSEDGIKKAVKMVSDVLSYPHSQLHGLPGEETPSDAKAEKPSCASNGVAHVDEAKPAPALAAEKQASPVSAEVNKVQPATSPPSSLVMTGDAQTMVSASSSLSSTPEPSSSKGPLSQIAGAPMLPPPANGQAPVSNAAPVAFNPVPLPGVAAASTFPPSAAQESLLLGPRSQSGRLLQPQQAPVGAIGGSIVQERSSLNQGIPTGPEISPRAPSQEHYLPGQHPPPSFHHQGAINQAPGNIQQPLQSAPMPQQNAFHPSQQPGFRTTGNQDLPVGAAPGGMWPSGPGLNPSVSAPRQESFRLDAAMDFLQHSKPERSDSLPLQAAVGRSHPSAPLQENPPIGLHRGQSTPSSMMPSGRDSLLVDSLFGSSGGASDSNIVSGVQGLSITDNGMGGGGLWGSSTANDRNGVQGLSLPVGMNGTAAQSTPSLFGAPAQPMQGSQQQQQQQQQSRFGWGAAPSR